MAYYGTYSCVPSAPPPSTPQIAGAALVGSTASGTLPAGPAQLAGAAAVTSTASGALSGGSSSAAADWAARSTAAGVMWAHNFASVSEVDRFRFDNWGYNDTTNADPANTVTWQADGFAGGGCCQISVPTGGIADGGWMRPFQALPGDRGYTSGPDWVGRSIGGTTNWGIGYYGNAAYQDASTNNGWPVWAGTDFYVQCRIKISASRFTVGNPDGKLIFFGITNLTPDQELVVQSLQKSVYSMYTNFGSRNNGALPSNQPGRVGSWQPGGAYAGTCIDNQVNASQCWFFPADSWVTVLIHIIPGLRANPIGSDSVDFATPGGNSTGIQVWTALPGDTSYTKIWDKLDYYWAFDPTPNGLNMFEPSAYMNNVNSVAGWTHRYTQVIFSKQSIACPQA